MGVIHQRWDNGTNGVHSKLPVGGRLPRKTTNCPTQHKHNTAELAALPEKSASPLGEHSLEDPLHLFAVLGGEIPVDRALQPLAKWHIRLPAEQSFTQRVVRHPLPRPNQHTHPLPDLPS